MQSDTLTILLRGASAGVIASIVQAMVGKTEEKLLLPPWEDSDIAPRLMQRLAEGAGTTLSTAARWELGTVFHLGYGAFWGMGYALVHERTRVHPLVGGVLLGGLIYGITFPRWGGAVQTETERTPERRTLQMSFVVASVTLAFGLTTALAYDAMARSRR